MGAHSAVTRGDRIRVGVLTTSFPMPGDSYNGVFVERLVNHLPEQVSPLVIVPAGTEKEAGIERPGQYSLLPFRYAPWRYQVLARQSGGIPAALQSNKFLYALIPVFLLAMAWACLRCARRVELFNANWSICGFIAGMVGYITDTPVITTLRGDDVTRAATSSVYFWLLKAAIRLSRRVVVVSEAIKETVGDWFPDERHKIVMIPNGVDAQFLEIERTYSREDSAPLRLLTVSALIRRKSVDTIIAALSEVSCKPEPVLVIVGDGPEHDKLQALVACLGLQKQVVFEGYADPEAVPGHLEAADIFILASHSEGRPNVILEAMASAMPIISSRIDGVVELIEDRKSGLLFNVDDSRDLAEKISSLCSDPELRERLGKAARDFITGNGLLWENTGRLYAREYRHCITRGDPG